jgi:hypothetical protein
VLDYATIGSTDSQVKQLFKLLRSNNNAIISYDEFEQYFNNYKIDKSIVTNIYDTGLKKGGIKGMRDMIRKLCVLEIETVEDEYF